MIHDAGWPIWLLIATSVTGLALVVERSLSLRQSLILPRQLLEDVMDMVRQQRASQQALERLAAQSPLGRVLAEVVSVRTKPAAYRRAAIESVGKEVARSEEHTSELQSRG